MLYTTQKGVQGFGLRRQYTSDGGAKISILPQSLMASLPTSEQLRHGVVKYGLPPLAMAAVATALLQSGNIQYEPATPTPQSPAVNAAATSVQPTGDNNSSNLSDGQTWPGSSAQSWNTQSAGSAATTTNRTPPSANTIPVQTIPSDTTGGRGGADTGVLPIPVTEVVPVPVPDLPVLDPVLDEPDDTETTPTENDGEVTVTTPIVQVGVDVFSPSVTLGLAP